MFGGMGSGRIFVGLVATLVVMEAAEAGRNTKDQLQRKTFVTTYHGDRKNFDYLSPADQATRFGDKPFNVGRKTKIRTFFKRYNGHWVLFEWRRVFDIMTNGKVAVTNEAPRARGIVKGNLPTQPGKIELKEMTPQEKAEALAVLFDTEPSLFNFQKNGTFVINGKSPTSVRISGWDLFDIGDLAGDDVLPKTAQHLADQY